MISLTKPITIPTHSKLKSLIHYYSRPRRINIVREEAVDYLGGMGVHTGRDPNVKKPVWLRQKAPQGERFLEVKESLSKLKLNTVCEEAQCPNIGEFKIYLQKNDEKGVISQLQSMTSCHDFTSDFLTLSSHESIASKALTVAIASLSNLLSLYFLGKPMPTPEVVVIRTLVIVLSQGPGNEREVLKFTKQARACMVEVSPEQFFGKGEVGRCERNWFAVNSWNTGTRAGREGKYEICTKFLELASEFYGATISGEEEENNTMVCKSLILSVSDMVVLEKQDSYAALMDSDVKRALKLLDRAGKVWKIENCFQQNKMIDCCLSIIVLTIEHRH